MQALSTDKELTSRNECEQGEFLSLTLFLWPFLLAVDVSFTLNKNPVGLDILLPNQQLEESNFHQFLNPSKKQ